MINFFMVIYLTVFPCSVMGLAEHITRCQFRPLAASSLILSAIRQFVIISIPYKFNEKCSIAHPSRVNTRKKDSLGGQNVQDAEPHLENRENLGNKWD